MKPLCPVFRTPRALAAAWLCASSFAALAQSTGGMQLQQPVPPPPPGVADVLPAMPAGPEAGAPASGPSVTLQAVRLQGNTWLSTAELLEAVGPVQGRRFDFEGLQALAQAVNRAYRARGYPFVRTVLPPQNLGGGELQLRVIEGVLGRVQLAGTDPLMPGAQPFLDAELRPGEPIRNATLERALLLLNDQPGFRVQPVLRPGQKLGEGDLVVAVQRRNDWSADLGLDNGGSRATGEWRARASAALNSPWRFGDRVTLNALVSDKRMWLGSAEYDAPLGGAGWRGAASVARTSYELDNRFSALGAQGQADVLGLRFTHALVRRQVGNLSLSLGLQHKALHDDFGEGLLVRDKTSRLFTLGAQFDLRDTLLGGGVTFGSASLAFGHLRLDAESALVDAASARTAGAFRKWNLDIARIQRLPGPFSTYLRLSAQGAGGNLDASEKMGLGGLLGVRAYPLGEASGDAGWLGQLELRWEAGWATPFLFHDSGRMRGNLNPWSPDSEGVRRISGSGLGLRWGQGPWSVEAMVAVRGQGGAPTADSRDRHVRGYVVLGRRIE